MDDEAAIVKINQLKARAHGLVEQLARRPYAASLLTKAIAFLEMAIMYKSNRKR